MSDLSPSEPASPASAAPLSRLARAERIVTLIALALGVLAAIYLMVTLSTEHEVCYGMQANSLICRPVDAGAAGWALLILLYPAVLLAAAAAGAWWQTRAVEPSAQSTAYGLLASSVVVLIGIVLPAAATAGFFLAPATIAMTIVGILGTIKFAQDFRAGRAAGK
jgi:hypothetical protein